MVEELLGREEAVCFRQSLPVITGVTQGSILGPLLNTLFTIKRNELLIFSKSNQYQVFSVVAGNVAQNGTVRTSKDKRSAYKMYFHNNTMSISFLCPRFLAKSFVM